MNMAAIPPEGDFEIVSLNLSDRTGIRKKPVDRASLVAGSGMAGDAHAFVEGVRGLENRQVSLLAVEEIEAASATIATKASCLGYASADDGAAVPASASKAPTVLVPGDFAENVTTRGLALHELPLGTRIEVGEVILEVSKIGKECHAACEIRRLVGDCVMPRKGIFVRVIRGGEVSRGSRCHYRFG